MRKKSVQQMRAAADESSSRVYSRTNVARYSERARQRQRGKRIRRTILLTLMGVLIAGVTACGLWFGKIVSKLNNGEIITSGLLSSLTDSDVTRDPFYMLLLGTDGRPGDTAYRADSIILARVDPKAKQVTLISIPRDTQVTIGTHGTQKINAAYAFGGPSGAIDAVSKLAGVPINHYAEIDFDGFKAVVDALGGIKVNVPMEINDDMAGGHVDAGEQTLNGEQALVLCRSRHNYDNVGNGDGDSIRAANQRMVISTIMKQLMSSDVATLTNTVSTLAQYITTDYSAAGILGLAQSMIGIDVENNVYSAQVPTTPVYENDVWYEKLNTSEWEKMMSRVKQGLSPTEDTVVDSATGAVMSSAGSGGSGSGDNASKSSGSASSSLSGVKVAVKNGSGIQGCASDAASKLTPQGAICETGNADDYNYKKTIVVYNGSDSSQAQKIVDLLGTGTVKKNDGTYSFNGDYLVVIGQDWG